MSSCSEVIDILIVKEDGSFDTIKACLINILLKRKGIVDYVGLCVYDMKVYSVVHDSIINYWIIDGDEFFNIDTLFN